VIITGKVRSKLIPRWYADRCGRNARSLALSNPGFHRVILECRPGPPYDLGLMVNPDIEPDLRRILSRCMRLDPAVPDDDPFPRL
jgi:hypothetical protein